MTSKAEYTATWKDETPAKRREMLDLLGSISARTEDEEREHDVLATMVAEDETAASDAVSKPEDENDV